MRVGSEIERQNGAKCKLYAEKGDEKEEIKGIKSGFLLILGLYFV